MTFPLASIQENLDSLTYRFSYGNASPEAVQVGLYDLAIEVSRLATVVAQLAPQEVR